MDIDDALAYGWELPHGLEVVDSVEIVRDEDHPTPPNTRRSVNSGAIALWVDDPDLPHADANPLSSRQYESNVRSNRLVVGIDSTVHGLQPYHANYRNLRDNAITVPLQLISVAQPLRQAQHSNPRLVGVVAVRRFSSTEVGADAVVVPAGTRMANFDSIEHLKLRPRKMMLIATLFAIVFFGSFIIAMFGSFRQ